MVRLEIKNLKYNKNRKAAKILALSSGRIDKFKYLTVEEILPFDQSRVISQAKFTYSPLGKDFKNNQKNSKFVISQFYLKLTNSQKILSFNPL